MGKQTKLRKSLAFAAVLLFMLLNTSCSKKDNAQVPENNDVKDDNAQEQCAEELPPTRVYNLKERSIPHNLFGKEAEEACKQNEERFKPVYDKNTDTCHLTVKEPTVQTKSKVRELLKHCVLHKELDDFALTPREKITGVCGTDKQHGYKTEVLFKNVKSFTQVLMEQCSKMDNCTCDKDANCTLVVNDHVLAEERYPAKYLGHDAWNRFDFSKWGFIMTLTKKIENGKYQVGFSPLPLKVIYTNVELLDNTKDNRCRLQCFKTESMDGIQKVLNGKKECICKPLQENNRQQ